MTVLSVAVPKMAAVDYLTYGSAVDYLRIAVNLIWQVTFGSARTLICKDLVRSSSKFLTSLTQ